MEGEVCSPWQQKDDPLAGPVLTAYLQSITNQAEYSYKQGKNILTLTIPKPVLSGVAQIICAVVLALLTSLVLKNFLPGSVSFLAHSFFEPLSQKGLELLGAVAIPVIFCSLVMGIISIGSPEQLNKNGRKLLRYFVEIKFYALVFFLLIVILTKPLSDSGNLGLEKILFGLGSVFLSFIPTNLFTPFTTGNTMQVVVLEIIAYVVVSLTAAAIALLLYAQAKLKFKLLPLLKKIKQPVLIALTTASSMAAYNSVMSTCKKELGLDPKFVNFAVPLGQIMMATGDVAAIIMLAVFGLNMNQIPVNFTVLITLAITSFIVSYGMAGSMGGSITIITMILVSWNIPNDCMALILTAYIFTDFFNTAMNILSNIISILLAGNALGKIDRKKLL